MHFDTILEQVLCEEVTPPFKAAVGIVRDKDKWLLGLAKNTGDDRSGKWCFPGGHMRNGESAKRAAVREVKEESGIKSHASGEPIRDTAKKGVAFVPCRADGSGQTPDPNHEFAAMGWFTKREMRSLKLYNNVKRLIDRVR